MKDRRRAECASELGFVFQFYNLVQNLLEENILLPLIMDGKKPSSYEKSWGDF
jgi:putative ABC transport system ATP-binding protein